MHALHWRRVIGYSFEAHHQDTLRSYGGVLPFSLQKLTEAVYGSATIDKDTWLQHYRAHNARVQSVIPAQQLLVLDLFAGDGWPQLCAFLGEAAGPCAAPAAAAFPLLNAQSARRERLDNIRAAALPALLGPGTGEFAYVSLLAHPSSDSRRPYLHSFLVAAESIRQTGSTYDIVALIFGAISDDDLALLEGEGIKVVPVGGVGASLAENPEAFDQSTAAIYRAKLRVLQLTEYDRVMFFDSDVVFTANCDDLLRTSLDFVGRAGSNSPLNAGTFIIRPSWQALVDISDVSLSMAFSPEQGWFEYGAIPDWRDARAPATDWSFYGASVDQGLLYFYYFCHRQGASAALLPASAWEGRATHFTGTNKPFLLGKLGVAALPKKFQAAATFWLSLSALVEGRAGRTAGPASPIRLSGRTRPAQGYPIIDAYPPPGLPLPLRIAADTRRSHTAGPASAARHAICSAVVCMIDCAGPTPPGPHPPPGCLGRVANALAKRAWQAPRRQHRPDHQHRPRRQDRTRCLVADQPPYTHAARQGVDVSEPTSSSAYSCALRDDACTLTTAGLKGQGYTFTIVRTFQSTGNPDPNGPGTINNAWAGGWCGLHLRPNDSSPLQAAPTSVRVPCQCAVAMLTVHCRCVHVPGPVVRAASVTSVCSSRRAGQATPRARWTA